jgi:hypothetical protein
VDDGKAVEKKKRKGEEKFEGKMKNWARCQSF